MKLINKLFLTFKVNYLSLINQKYLIMQLLRIKEILKEKHIINKEFARELNINPVTLSRIASGTSFPSGDLLLQIANSLNVDIRELFYPTKGFGESPELNGFIEYKNETYKIKNSEDIENLLLKIKTV